jgi:tRNA A37 N6-isopentenylltransferase MiaA
MTTPAWLKEAYPVPPADVQRLSPALAHYNAWINLKDTVVVTEKDAMQALIIEVSGKHRPLLIERIKHRFNTMRHKREMNELYRSEIHREGYRGTLGAPVQAEEVVVHEVRKPRTSRSPRSARTPK